MKQIGRTVLSVALLLSLCLFARFKLSEVQHAEVPYSYAIVETDEWRTMSLSSRMAACQIPQDVVESLSTPDLLQAIIDNPFSVTLFACSEPEAGLNALRRHIRATDNQHITDRAIAAISAVLIEPETSSLSDHAMQT